MKRLEMLLTILMEECNELAIDTSKAIRFGLDEQRDLPTSNRERMNKEYNDLIAVVDMINAEVGDVFRCNTEAMRKKQEKVEKYMKYSQECGTLETERGGE